MPLSRQACCQQFVLVGPTRSDCSLDQASIFGYSLFLPASAKISVDADQTQQFVQLRLSESQLRIKIIGFVREYLQVAGGPTSIARLRKPGGVFSGSRELLLLLSELPVFAVFD